MVETRGVEPLSEGIFPRVSPSAVSSLRFASPNSNWQDLGYASFIDSTNPQSFGLAVPR